MPSDYEWSQANLEKLVAWSKENDSEGSRNEATTRLHLIDRLLFECLGWEHEDCVSEERFEGTYTDYSLGETTRLLVVEAKREGIHFELPAGFDKHICNLKTLHDLDDSIAKAITQALTYCQERGIPIGAICNGHQLVAFIGSRADGIPPREGRALVFGSLPEMKDRFLELWENLSKPGIAAFKVYATLRETVHQPPPGKLSQRIPNYPGFKDRNPLQVTLRTLGDLFILDVTTHPEVEAHFLGKCYCPSGALSQYALVSKQILETRYSMMFRGEPDAPSLQAAQTKRGLAPELSTDILAASISRRPIVLLGDVGVGKTIFIRHFISVEARDILEKAIVLYISFSEEPALVTDLERYVLDCCEKQLFEKHGIDTSERQFVRGVYHFELERFGKSYFSDLKKIDESVYQAKEIEFLETKVKDTPNHLKASLEHLTRGQKRQLVLFLDNIDQRDFEFQEKAFLIATGLAAHWPGTVFVSLRPDTFYQSRAKGALTAYQPRVFTIAPPRIDQVLARRLDFAMEELQQTGRLQSFPKNITIHSDTLCDYFEVIRDSLQSNKPLMEFVDNLSGGNVRRAIDFLRDFVGSGHVNTTKILRVKKESGSYTIPVHEFLRAVVYGDHEHYDPAASTITNLFDISIPDSKEHFLLPLVLSLVERLGALGEEQGYVELRKLYDTCQEIGFTPLQINFAIDRALKGNLLESSPRFSDARAKTRVRITTIGAYSVKRLIAFFSYTDAMIVDTPIVDPVARATIQDEDDISHRLDRAEAFCSYLDRAWYPLSDKELPFQWRTVRGRIRGDIDRIRSSPRLAFLK